MVTISEALKLIEAGFSVEDIRAMDTPAEQPKPEQKQEPKQEPTPEQKADTRIDALTTSVEKLVGIVGKMPFFANMGEPKSVNDSADEVLASIINPTFDKKE